MSNDNPNINTSSSHRAVIRQHLEAGNSLTSRIDELRQAGLNITTTMIPVKNRAGKLVRVAEYRLADAEEVAA